MDPSCPPNRFHRTALGLPATIAAKHPAIALGTLVKLHLLFMHFCFVVFAEFIVLGSEFLQPFDLGYTADKFAHFAFFIHISSPFVLLSPHRLRYNVRMKRVLILIFIVILWASTLSPALCQAEEVPYLEIDRDNVCLYKNAYRPDVLFVIPKTFYVKYLDTADSIYYVVEYNGVEGLLRIEDVSGKQTVNVANPYYTATNVSAHINSFLYSKPSFSALTALSAYGLTLTFLGKAQGEAGTYGTPTWFAVLYTNQVYYIHSAMTENLDLLESAFAPVHPNSATYPASSGKYVVTPEIKNSEGSVDALRIALVVGMIVPILIILFLLFRPHKRKPVKRRSTRDRYPREEEEYDDY